nr:hypothetical protein CFP56_35365 [Quercus suber]
MAIVEKQVMVVGIDDKEHSTFALDWTLKQFFTPFASNPIFRLVIVQAKPSPSVSKPGESEEVLPYFQADLNRIAALVAERASEICGLNWY